VLSDAEPKLESQFKRSWISVQYDHTTRTVSASAKVRVGGGVSCRRGCVVSEGVLRRVCNHKPTRLAATARQESMKVVVATAWEVVPLALILWFPAAPAFAPEGMSPEQLIVPSVVAVVVQSETEEGLVSSV
jgi:hypothetical protein